MTQRGERRYDAFLSYGHAADRALAPVLASELQRYAKPWYRARALRVFRDDADLAAEPALWGAIERALAASSWFVLLASPAAAASPWVEREVSWWLERRDPDRLLVVLSAGTLADALPPALRDAEEPRWVDLRALGHTGDVDRADPRLREGVVDVAATIRGIGKDRLVGEHLRSHRRAMRLAGAAIATLSLLLVAAVVASLVAVAGRTAAVEAQRLTAARSMQGRADALRDRDPAASLRYGAAAAHLAPDDAAARASLLQTVTTSPFRGGLPGRSGLTVTATAWFPDGRLLVTADGPAVRFWDGTSPGDHRQVGSPLPVDRTEVSALAVSPDGRALATAGPRYTSLWDVTDPARPTPLARRPTSLAGPDSVAFSADGRLLAVGTRLRDPGTRAALFDVTDRSDPRPWALPPSSPALGAEAVFDAAFSSAGPLFVTGAEDGLRLWDVADPRAPRLLTPLDDPTLGVTDPRSRTMALSPDGRVLAVGRGGDVQLWDLGDPAHPRPLGRPFPGVAPVFGADGRVLVTNDGESVALWDVAEPGAIRVRRRLALEIEPGTPSTSRSGLLALGKPDGQVALWDLTGDDRPRPTGVLRRDVQNMGTPSAWSPDGRTLAMVTGAGTGLWELDGSGHLQPVGTLPVQLPLDVAFSPRRPLVATITDDRFSTRDPPLITLWDTGDRAHPHAVRTFSRPPGRPAVAMAFSEDGDLLAVAGRTDVELWSIADPENPRSVGVVGGGAHRPLAFSRGGTTLSTGGPEEATLLWDVHDPGAPVLLAGRPYEGTSPGGPNDSAAGFTGDGSSLIVLGHAGLTRWDLSDARVPRRSATSPEVQASGDEPLSADRRTAAAVDPSDPSVVVLRDLDDPERAGPFGLPFAATPAAGATAHLALSPDGRTLVADTEDRTTLWDLGPLQDLRRGPVRAACTRAGPLDPATWETVAPGLPYEDVCAGPGQ